MPISIVVGGQYGSEGKGKVSHWLAREQGAMFSIRVGASNSGHTVVTKSKRFVLRQLPTSAIDHRSISVIPAGAYVDLAVLLREIDDLCLHPDQLLMHPDCILVEGWMKAAELQNGLVERIGSTGQGVGIAVAERVLRTAKVRRACDVLELKQYVRADLPAILDSALRAGKRILIEGTQGFGLSILHGGHYPYCTSRDTTAAGVLSEAGLSPMDVDCITLVVRAFPIRVAGSSGPLPREISWTDIERTSGANDRLAEKSTVSQRVRRVAKFDAEIVHRAMRANRPTLLCLNHADYFDYSIHESDVFSRIASREVSNLEEQIGRPIDLVGTGPSQLVHRPATGWTNYSTDVSRELRVSAPTSVTRCTPA